MKKRGIALAMASVMLCATLAGCGAIGHEDDVYHTAQESVNNLALNKTIVQPLSETKTRSAAKAADGEIGTYYTSKTATGMLEIDFGEAQSFNTIVLREKGWNIQQYHIEGLIKQPNGDEYWETVYVGDRIEDLRMCAFEETITTAKLRLVVDTASQQFAIREIEVTNLAPTTNDDFRVCSYVSTGELMGGGLFNPEGNTYLDPKSLDVITEINFLGNVGLKADGTLAVEHGVMDANGVETAVVYTYEEFSSQLNRLRDVIAGRDVKLTMTVSTGKNEDAVIAMTTNQDTLITNTVKFAELYGFDGISYDWERPANQEQFDIFSDYLIALKPKLIAANKRLTLAWAAWGINMKEEAVKTADAIEIMSYDLFDQYGHQASFMESTVQAIDYFVSLGYELKQLNIGLPYYGRPIDGSAFWPLYNDERYNLGRYDDTDSEFVANKGKSYFNSYQTVMDKTAYAIARGVGGMMVFRGELDRPFDSDTSLTKAIGKTIDQRLTTENGGAN